MNADAITDAAITAQSGFRSSHTPRGKTTAPMIEPMEMCFVQATVATKTGTTARIAQGVRYRNAPTKVATALPPLNFRNTGYACPAMTARAAAAIQHGQPS